MSSLGASAAHLGFLRHAGYLWAKVSLWLCATAIAAYVWHAPPDGPNGGSWLGYTLGGVGTALILWLLWLGVRKRRYRSTLGSVKGWTSAHVYLGLSLIVIATLHCGFQFGLNIHTLAYALMVLVVASGVWGIVAYDRLPTRITQLRSGTTREAWVDEVFDLNEQTIKLADQMTPAVHQRIVASAEKLRLGGSLRQQWRGAVSSQETAALTALLHERANTLLRERDNHRVDPSAQSTVMFMAGQLRQAAAGEQEALRIQQLLDLVARRNELVGRINRDVGLHARLQLWLLFHVPLSFALLAALIAHVVSVFFYW